MLPDCPQVKHELSHKLQLIFRQTVNRYIGVVGEAPRSVIHEGRRVAMIRETGEVDETQLFQASAEMQIRPEEVATMTAEVLGTRMEVAAREMAKQMSDNFFKTIGETADKIGNTVDGKGKPFSAELLFEILEKISIEFDLNGKPLMPTLTIHPSRAEQVKKVFESIDATPELSARFEQIIQQKREEWNAREAARKLVG